MKGVEKHAQVFGYFFEKTEKLFLQVDAMGSQVKVFVKELNSDDYFKLSLDQRFPSESNHDLRFEVKPHSGL